MPNCTLWRSHLLKVSALPSLWGEKINVGWVERSETQLDQGFWVLGFVPQPNLRLNL
ncbi:hypothetical protein [Nostoc sp. 106C]|uniref:hypothetical protein n=1 Tax=Nostoc sp. 106C TaxID=1932667 RepID=UPI001411B5CD|nr:hypothetical protein [Nostoc sp. 106C]